MHIFLKDKISCKCSEQLWCHAYITVNRYFERLVTTKTGLGKRIMWEVPKDRLGKYEIDFYGKDRPLYIVEKSCILPISVLHIVTTKRPVY